MKTCRDMHIASIIIFSIIYPSLGSFDFENRKFLELITSAVCWIPFIYLFFLSFGFLFTGSREKFWVCYAKKKKMNLAHSSFKLYIAFKFEIIYFSLLWSLEGEGLGGNPRHKWIQGHENPHFQSANQGLKYEFYTSALCEV